MATPCWSSRLDILPGLFCLLSSRDLARCSLVCKSWADLLLQEGTPWQAAMAREHGYIPQCFAERDSSRRLLIAAHTSQLYIVGSRSLDCSTASRFTVPHVWHGLSHIQPAVCDVNDTADSPSGVHGQHLFKPLPVARLSIRQVAAGADFAVLLSWDGRVVDTRCLHPAAGPSAPGRPSSQGCLEWQGAWEPPCGQAVSVASGGCWQGSGRPGGHTLVVVRLSKDQHTVWAWGANTAGQLGLGSSTRFASTNAHPSWVAAPTEVLDCQSAASLGQPVAAACGEEHSLLVCRDGALLAAGSNSCGACGLPIVQLQSSSFTAVACPPGMAAVTASCGGHNTAVVTACGRLLVCGANEHGQCGVGRAGGACLLLTDIGPSSAWHGMQRSHQPLGGGQGQAAPEQRVVAAACGAGSLYALTQQGEVFAWGQGGQGELGLGGHSKVCCTPAKLPWARGATCVAASSGGRFAAVVDECGRLHTFGAGRTGALGHGDTAKKAVGRPVKALQSRMVHAVGCGADWMLVVTGWRAQPGRPARSSRSSANANSGVRACPWHSGSSLPQQPALQEGPPPAQDRPLCGFCYREVEPPSPGAPHQGQQRPTAAQCAQQPSTLPHQSRRHSRAAGAAASERGQLVEGYGLDTGSGRLRGRAGRDERREEAEEGQGRRRSGRGHCRLHPLDMAPEAALMRRQRWMAEPPATASQFSPQDSGSDGEGDDGGALGRRRHRGACMDREMAYLLRRQLKAFAADPGRRQLAFPRSFSSRDRWKIHVMAESWGLLHESHGEGERRRLIVWKPSGRRKSLKPEMLQQLGDSDVDSVSNGG